MVTELRGARRGMRRTAAIVGAVIALLVAAPAAVAEQRLALVIGNDLYPNLSADRKLNNAVNDARAMAETLKVLGFDILGGAEAGRPGENLWRNDIIDRLGELASRVQPGDIVFFFFAGHGVSLQGSNILLPSDIPAPRGFGALEEDRYVQRGIAEGYIIEQLTKLRAKAVIIALDACRNNPIASGERTVGGPRGFLPARIEVRSGAFFFSIYSAGYGQVAMDRLGPSDRNSVFTRVFVESLRQPGQHIQEVASRTRKEVHKLALARGYDQFLAYMDQLNPLDDLIYLGGVPVTGALSRQAQDKQLVEDAQAQLTKAAANADKSALPMGPEQLRLALTDAATSRVPAKRAALQMIADGGVEEGAQALEDYAREGTQLLATLSAAAHEQKVETAQSWREAGAIWRFKSIVRAIENYERALHFEPGDFSTNVELVRLYRNSGRIADAHIAVQRLAPRSDEPVRVIVAAKETGDVLSDRGDLEGALRQFDLAVRTWEAAGQPDLKETGIIFRGTVPWTWRGDVLLSRGRTEEALQDLRLGLNMARQTAAQQPDNAQAQRQLSIGLGRIGDVLRARKDFAGAMKAYEEGIAIDRRVAALDANDAQAQRDLSVSLERIGDMLRARNDLAGAMTAYEEMLTIARRLTAFDPDNAVAQRDLSVSLGRIGDVFRARDDLAGAMKAYEEVLAIRRRLAALDADNAQAQRDLSLSLGRIGDVFRARDDLAGTMKAYEEMLAIRRRLAALDANNAEAQRDLSVSLGRIGDIFRGRNDLAGAMKAYEEGLAIDRRLVALNPDNAQAQSDLSWSLARVQEIADAMNANRTLEADPKRDQRRGRRGRRQ
jgi:tetratricopeptide (TPR) repeat protein